VDMQAAATTRRSTRYFHCISLDGGGCCCLTRGCNHNLCNLSYIYSLLSYHISRYISQSGILLETTIIIISSRMFYGDAF
jgi:hypothetical protein